MKKFFFKIMFFLFTFIFIIFLSNKIYAAGPVSTSAWPNEWCIRKNINSGNYFKVTDYMGVGKTSLDYYRGLLIFSTDDVPDNSIITGHDEFFISVSGDPPSENFEVRAMEIKKNPNKTDPGDLWKDCGEGDVYSITS